MSNDVLRSMAAHRTIRKYASDLPSEDQIQQVVQAAQCAPTSSNMQGYCVIRVRDEAKRAQLEALTGGQAQVRTAGAFFVICADQRRHRLVAESESRAYAPNLETFLVGTVDASLFAQNLTLGFESLGLGTCFIGGLRTRLPEVDTLLDIPADVFPLFGLCVGRPADDPGRRPRLPLEAVLMEETYPSDDQMRGHVAAYDETMRDYYAERGKPGYDWSGGTARKFETPQRTHLHAYYSAKGARLT